MALEREVTLEELAGLIAGRVAGLAGGQRLLVALAGPPGAGKSTCAAMLEAALNAQAPCRPAVFQMDGYHYDDAILIARGLRPRKGSPETFDVPGFAHMLARLRANATPEIAVPVFDRELEISRAGARMIARDVNVLIVEGNYVLLDREPWSQLAPLFDLTVAIRVPPEVLEERLTRRWRDHGIPDAEIPAKVQANDLPNGRLVLSESRKPDFVLRT